MRRSTSVTRSSPNRCGYLPGKQVVPIEEMLARINAALDARTDPNLIIHARTDAYGVDGLDAAIERCQIFLEAGVDFAKPQGVDTIEEIKRVIREVPARTSATMSQAAGKAKATLDELEEAGVTAVSFPSVALFSAAQAIRKVLGSLKTTRSLEGSAGDLFPLEEYYELVGLPQLLKREESYDIAEPTPRETGRGEGARRPRRRRVPGRPRGQGKGRALAMTIDHLSIQCADVGSSAAFFDAVLAPLRGHRLMDFGDVVGYGDTKPEFLIGSASRAVRDSASATSPSPRQTGPRCGPSSKPPSRRAPRCSTSRGSWAEYHPDYFGAFVRDPDGNNVEAVCHLPEVVPVVPSRDDDHLFGRDAKVAGSASGPALSG